MAQNELRDSLQEIVDDLCGKKKISTAHSVEDLDQLLNADERSESSK